MQQMPKVGNAGAMFLAMMEAGYSADRSGWPSKTILGVIRRYADNFAAGHAAVFTVGGGPVPLASRLYSPSVEAIARIHKEGLVRFVSGMKVLTSPMDGDVAGFNVSVQKLVEHEINVDELAGMDSVTMEATPSLLYCDDPLYLAIIDMEKVSAGHVDT